MTATTTTTTHHQSSTSGRRRRGCLCCCCCQTNEYLTVVRWEREIGPLVWWLRPSRRPSQTPSQISTVSQSADRPNYALAGKWGWMLDNTEEEGEEGEKGRVHYQMANDTGKCKLLSKIWKKLYSGEKCRVKNRHHKKKKKSWLKTLNELLTNISAHTCCWLLHLQLLHISCCKQQNKTKLKTKVWILLARWWFMRF